MTETTISVDDVEFVKELYPRVREDDAAIERYRAAIDRLPPIVVARGRVLVDGFHRWQAHKRERLATLEAVDLGNLTDVEILKESIKRNATHGRQLETSDKKRMAGVLWLKGSQDEGELAEILSLTSKSLTEYLRDAKRAEKLARKDEAWDRWLNCEFNNYSEAGRAFGIDADTAKSWISEKSNALENSEPPESRQHFDVWQFLSADDDAGQKSYFGRMPPQVVENLLWLYTQPGDIVVDPFAGGGTTIDVAKRMGRRVWASDLHPSTPTLPIHEHDITTGWPDGAPKADLIILDPPYWQQAKGRYSDDVTDLANMGLDAFYKTWQDILVACAAHLADDGRIAYIISPTELKDEGRVIDHATDMIVAAHTTSPAICMHVERRVIVTYQTQQATGQQVEWAREKKQLLKLYRDLVVMAR